MKIYRNSRTKFDGLHDTKNQHYNLNLAETQNVLLDRTAPLKKRLATLIKLKRIHLELFRGI